MKDHKRVVSTILGLLLLAAGCVAPSPPAPPPAAAAPTSAQAGGQTIVAIAPPATPPQTLPQWLGINDMVSGVGGLCQAKHQLFGALFPQLSTAMAGLEPPPALKSLTNPANLGPNAPPGVKDIAQVKADEDAAPQKIAAIKYAATIGCVKGHPGIERAFLHFLDDPTEAVRFEAAKALAEMLGTPCETCPKGSCCTPQIYKKLSEIVTREKSPGCYVEYSDRVRRVARLAMHNCGAPPPEPRKVGPDQIEGPGKAPLPKKEKIEGPLPPPPAPGITAKTAASVKPAAGAKSKRAESAEDLWVLLDDKHGKPPVAETQTGAGRVHQISGSDADRPAALMVQWERVSVPYSNFGSHKDAFAAVNYLRARVLGARLLRSPGFRKDQVSVQTFDWTDLSTVSPSVLARTLKTLPIGQVSPVLKDRQGYHLVRVLQRQYRNVSATNPMMPQPPQAAKSGPILQTGGRSGDRQIHHLQPDARGNRTPQEQWPPDLGSLPEPRPWMDASRRTHPGPRPAMDASRRTHPGPRPWMDASRRTDPEPRQSPTFPVVDENADRPPLPEPVPQRPVPQPKPEPVPSATPKPARIPTIIDTRSKKTAPAVKRGNAAAFPFGNVPRPATTDRQDDVRFEPFPADREPPKWTKPHRRVNSDIASPSDDARVFGDELNPRRQAATIREVNRTLPASGSQPGRFHLPKARETIPDQTPARVRVQPDFQQPTTANDRSETRVPDRLRSAGPQSPLPMPQVPARRTALEAPIRPVTSAPPKPIEPKTEAQSPKIADPAPRPAARRSSARPIWDLDPAPSTSTHAAENSARRTAFQAVRHEDHGRPPDRLPHGLKSRPTQGIDRPAATTSNAKDDAASQPRRRGNVTIQSGRRSAVREISFGMPRVSRTADEHRSVGANSPAQRTVAKPRTSPASGRFLPIATSSDYRESSSGTAPSSTGTGRTSTDSNRPMFSTIRSHRKEQPLFFSRSGNGALDASGPARPSGAGPNDQ